MLIVIDKRSGVPIFKQIMDQVKQQILTNQLKEGVALTSVKDLSAELLINPMTVSKAYSLLEFEGYLDRKKGIGLFVQKPKQELTKRAKMDALEGTFAHPVIQAIQMDVPLDDLAALLSKLYKHYKPKGS